MTRWETQHIWAIRIFTWIGHFKVWWCACLSGKSDQASHTESLWCVSSPRTFDSTSFDVCAYRKWTVQQSLDLSKMSQARAACSGVDHSPTLIRPCHASYIWKMYGLMEKIMDKWNVLADHGNVLNIERFSTSHLDIFQFNFWCNASYFKRILQKCKYQLSPCLRCTFLLVSHIQHIFSLQPSSQPFRSCGYMRDLCANHSVHAFTPMFFDSHARHGPMAGR